MHPLRRFNALLLAIAFALVTLGTLPTPARAADLITVAGSPALKYEFGPFERRGVRIPGGGTLVVRNDGCWRADMEVLNASGLDRAVSVVIEFTDPRGRFLTDVVVVGRQIIPNTGVLVADGTGCNGALAAAFPLRRHSVRRIFSVR